MNMRSMKIFHRRTVAAVLALLAAATTAHLARADGGRPGSGVPVLPKYKQECAACHIAYPPGMLPAASWQRVLDNLSRHYGTDASLDPATVAQLSTWLTRSADTYERMAEVPPQDRITRSAWFLREHGEVRPAAWKVPAVKSPSNCVACHARADQGNFNEHDVRIPR